MSTPHSNLFTRVMTALVLLPVVLALVWIPVAESGFAILVAAIAVIATRELYDLLRACGATPRERVGLLGALGLVGAAYFGSVETLNVALAVAIVLVGLAHVVRDDTTGPGVAGSMMGLLYTAWCPAHIVLMHQIDGSGRGLVMLLLAVVVFTDTFAYFIGKNFGTRKLAPVVSPKKTWEGAAGGFVFAVSVAIALHYARGAFGWTAFPDWSPLRYGFAAAGVSVVAQISDLVKSSVKRDAGVKDSGTIFPGHGGALDRCDGFLLSAPVLYYTAVL